MKIGWIEPLEFIKKYEIPGDCYAFLYSGMRTDFTGRFSYLAINPKEEITGDNFDILESKIKNCWFGYLGYGLKNRLEKLPVDPKPIITNPDLWMVNYNDIIIFDHEMREIKNIPANLAYKKPGQKKEIKISTLKSNMSKNDYLRKVEIIKDHIARGDLYQANLTRKFFCEIENHDPLDIFIRLCETSPSPYSAIMKFHDLYIISSSPEQFLKIDNDGNVETRPIKGTSARKYLKNSSKDRAENLMIVDLMRNDLSRSSIAGSVEVKSLYDVTEYKTLNHMSSTITGKKRNGISIIDVVKNCFPPGSMTGAPKIQAIKLCSDLEPNARGIYSGALGWFGKDGNAELSVVIRTIIIRDNMLEFQVGGGIIADSEPESEWQETIAKSVGIINALGIPQEKLEKL